MMSDNLEKQLGQIEHDLGQPIPEHSSTQKEPKVAKKVDKKAAKKVAKSPKKSAAVEATAGEDSGIKLETLASEAGISTAAARRKLRTAEVDRGDGRWSFKDGSSSHKAARKALGLEA